MEWTPSALRGRRAASIPSGPAIRSLKGLNRQGFWLTRHAPAAHREMLGVVRARLAFAGSPDRAVLELQGFGDSFDRFDARAKARDVLPMLAKAGVRDVSHVEFGDTTEGRPAELRTDFRFSVVWGNEE